MNPILAIGLMSGTSMDGVDAALIETDGVRLAVGGNGRVQTEGRTVSLAYSPAERALLVAAKEEAKRGLHDRWDRPGWLAEAEALVTRRHAEAVEALLAEAGIRAGEVAVVGFHGQTVLHRPEAGLTVQIGDGPALAARLRIPVVHDFRAADVEAGGEGAPLVPVFHRALAAACGFEPPLAVLNIGGVANVTFIGRGEADLVGFDTGPGNALLDDLMAERTGTPCDTNGAAAAAGRADEALLGWMLDHPFFGKPPPKSLDRDAFSHRLVATLPLADAAATLAAFTVRAAAHSARWAPEPPGRWVVGGGGARNPELMRLLREVLRPAEVVSADAIGWSGDFLEAQAFAYLAARKLKDLPITFPSTTGAPRPLPGGVMALPP